MQFCKFPRQISSFTWLQTGFTYICFLKTVAKAIDGRYATDFGVMF